MFLILKENHLLMPKILNLVTKLTLSIFVLFCLFSCSKDADLLSEYVITKNDDTQSIVLLSDDSFFITPGENSILMDVLNNDTFSSDAQIKIVSTSIPNNGEVTINNDNTLTYVTMAPKEVAAAEAPVEQEPLEDTFTYTAEQTEQDGGITSEVATVTVSNRAPTSGENVFYVTTTGKSDNNGKSEAAAWNLDHAFKVAKAGDVVYVKAGDYGYKLLASVRSGTSENPIRFLGYNTIPGDIVSTNGSTYSIDDWEANGRTLPLNVMPILRLFANNFEPANTDRAFKIEHDYIHIENFMIRGYQYGVDSETGTTSSKFKNIICYKMGDWNPSDPNYGNSSVSSPTNQQGFGIRLQNSTSCEISDMTVIDPGFIGIWLINSNNNTLNNNGVYVRDSGNASDYLTELNGSNNNVINNHIGNRIVPDLSVGHQGRGFTLKESAFNTINNLTCLNTRVQINVVSKNNTFNKVTLIGSGGSNQNEFQIYGMSDNNTVNDLYQFNGGGIQFLGWTGQEGGYPAGNYPSGNNNYFINPIIDNLSAIAGNALVSFHRLSGTADAGTNFIVGGTFSNAAWIINANRTGIINFTDCTFTNISSGLDTFYSGWPDATGLYKANYTNCDFSGNAFANPNSN